LWRGGCHGLAIRLEWSRLGLCGVGRWSTGVFDLLYDLRVRSL
jgi:hypothetical protein